MAERDLVVRLIGDDASLRRAFVRSSTGTKQFSRDVSAATRGAAAGSGAFRSLGRSIVFASGGFLAFTSGAAFLRKTVDAAKEAQVANAQLATQLANSGKSFQAYRAQIDATINRLSALAGIEDDELKSGLTTILRTVPDVTKALRDLSTATDLARARHISLASAATIIAKTEAGNTTLLRRQGFQIAANATAEQALATVRAKIAGQAAAGTTAQERFGAVLHQTEEIIGTGILPTLNKYLESGSKWLQQMNQSGKLQRDVASAAHDFEKAMSAVADTVKVVDKLTGSFKNTLEILVGIKVASIVLRWAESMNLFAAAEARANESAVVSRINAYTGAVAQTGNAAAVSAGKVNVLRGSLAGLGLINIAPILIPVEIEFANKEHAFLGKFGRAGSAGQVLLDLATNNLGGNIIEDAKDALLGKKKMKLQPQIEIDPKVQVKNFLDKAKKLIDGAVLGPAKPSLGGSAGGSSGGLTVDRRNTFFDNQISRILLRGGLGNIAQQISALQKADTLIEQRLRVTKDVTRRLNLEDELMQNVAQIKTLNAQQAADALQKRQDAFSEFISKLQLGVTKAQATATFNDDIAALKALQAGLKKEIAEFGKTSDLTGQLFDVQQQIKQAKSAKVTARQFQQLGLTATGDERTPLVSGLKKRLAQLSENVNASSLNTPKLQSELARFRKVLGEGLVPKDVRAKIKDMMDGIAQQIKDANGPLTKTTALSANSILNGLGLGRQDERIIRARLSHFNSAGVALSGAGTGSRSVTVNAPPVYLDGRLVSKNTSKHQARTRKRNAPQRNGPNAGIVFD